MGITHTTGVMHAHAVLQNTMIVVARTHNHDVGAHPAGYRQHATTHAAAEHHDALYVAAYYSTMHSTMYYVLLPTTPTYHVHTTHAHSTCHCARTHATACIVAT